MGDRISEDEGEVLDCSWASGEMPGGAGRGAMIPLREGRQDDVPNRRGGVMCHMERAGCGKGRMWQRRDAARAGFNEGGHMTRRES